MTRGASGFGLEESQRMPAFDNERLVIGKDFKVLFYQAILHPILAHLPRLTVSDKFVRVKGYVETKIIVNHHLECLAFNAVPLVFVDGFRFEVAAGGSGSHRYVHVYAVLP